MRNRQSGEGRVALAATLALLGITAAWGSTFFLIHDLLDRVPVPDFLAVRFAIASVAMLAVAPRAVTRLPAAARRHAVVLGVLYAGAQLLQTAGLARTPASVSGFITGLYVVATPLLAALVLRTRIGRSTWVAVAVAVAGLAVLTLGDLGGAAGAGASYGEALTLVSAVVYALHIVGLGAWSTPADALGLSIVQCLVIAVVCGIAAAPGGITLPSGAHAGADWVSIVYMALVAGALALFGQTWAQAHLPPTRSAIVMSMEPVFAAVFAVLLGGEQATLRMLAGGGLVLAAMLVVELTPRRPVEGEVQHLVV
ncbi:MAG: EamA-like transporter family protein [Marmoricola sp.]|nr:EamA-like transporter family protein [Marmoricola sp.]